jgi:hypothetical protein
MYMIILLLRMVTKKFRLLVVDIVIKFVNGNKDSYAIRGTEKDKAAFSKY